MSNVLVVGSSRGLGHELAKQYASQGATVYGTSRSEGSKDDSTSIHWISGIDIAQETAGQKLAAALKANKLDTVIITAGYFGKESFDEPGFDDQIRMYTTSAIGPVFIIHHIYKAGLLPKGAKIILVSSESGSITLRHESVRSTVQCHVS